VRSHDGPEASDLAGYRSRYAQYLGDTDLQASRAACPWIVIWDDHEVENNYAGLLPDDPAEAAAFPARRDAAYRAWWEHMPVRLPPPEAGAPFLIQRTVAWGGLAEFVLLDGRQFRSDQACGSPVLSLDPPCPEAADPARTMLGAAQEAWVGDVLAASSATWPTICQQTVLTDVRFNGAILNYDQWDGYPPARDRLLAQAAAADRVVVLTGDIHLAGVGRLPGVGIEFIATSISSPANVDPSLQPLIDMFPNLAGTELRHRGYVRHTVTPERWSAEYRIVADVARADSPVDTWRTFHVDAAVRDAVTAT
jgi:alkaline phosphatase D